MLRRAEPHEMGIHWRREVTKKICCADRSVDCSKHSTTSFLLGKEEDRYSLVAIRRSLLQLFARWVSPASLPNVQELCVRIAI